MQDAGVGANRFLGTDEVTEGYGVGFRNQKDQVAVVLSLFSG
jgi:hypothetical protein